jgi:hypothetical protein
MNLLAALKRWLARPFEEEPEPNGKLSEEEAHERREEVLEPEDKAP